MPKLPKHLSDVLTHLRVQMLFGEHPDQLSMYCRITNLSQCFGNLRLCQRVGRGLQHLEQACDDLLGYGIVSNRRICCCKAMASQDQVGVEQIILQRVCWCKPK